MPAAFNKPYERKGSGKGKAACAAFVLDQQGNLVASASKYLGELTNNQAEYQSLICGPIWRPIIAGTM